MHDDFWIVKSLPDESVSTDPGIDKLRRRFGVAHGPQDTLRSELRICAFHCHSLHVSWTAGPSSAAVDLWHWFALDYTEISIEERGGCWRTAFAGIVPASLLLRFSPLGIGSRESLLLAELQMALRTSFSSLDFSGAMTIEYWDAAGPDQRVGFWFAVDKAEQARRMSCCARIDEGPIRNSLHREDFRGGLLDLPPDIRRGANEGEFIPSFLEGVGEVLAVRLGLTGPATIIPGRATTGMAAPLNEVGASLVRAWKSFGS